MADLPYEDQSFDGIVCVWSTGHGLEKDVVQSIKEMHRVLKVGGVLLSDFPSTKDPNFGRGPMLEKNTFLHPHLDHPDVPHHYLTKDSLLSVLRPLFSQVSVEETVYDDPKYNSKLEAFWVQAQKESA